MTTARCRPRLICASPVLSVMQCRGSWGPICAMPIRSRLEWLGVDTGQVENPAAWLTTVVARVCLTMLEVRRARNRSLPDSPLRSAAPAGRYRHSSEDCRSPASSRPSAARVPGDRSDTEPHRLLQDAHRTSHMYASPSQQPAPLPMLGPL